MPATIREKLIAVLTAQGYQKVNGGSHKYVTLAHPGVANSFLFVGKSGALRQGECASRSHSVDALKKSILSDYEKTKFILSVRN